MLSLFKKSQCIYFKYFYSNFYFYSYPKDCYKKHILEKKYCKKQNFSLIESLIVFLGYFFLF